MNSSARFDESRLPSHDAFFSKLSDSPCSDTEYAHATQVWTAFECESMADYHDISGSYPTMMKTDTYLRWISAIHNIYTTLATTTHSPPSRWRLIGICIHPLSRQSFHRLHLNGNSRKRVAKPNFCRGNPLLIV